MNVMRVFNEFQKVMGICPCCGDVFRLSEARVYTTKRPPMTEFDRLDREWEKFVEAEQRFTDHERAIRREASRKGEVEAKNKLRKISQYFTGHRIHPHDVYAIFDPVHFIAFDGLCDDRLSRVAFVDEAVPERQCVHESIEKAIDAGNIEWATLRIDDEGRVQRER